MEYIFENETEELLEELFIPDMLPEATAPTTVPKKNTQAPANTQWLITNTRFQAVINKESQIPKNTRKTTNWAVNSWTKWSVGQKAKYGDEIPPIHEYIKEKLGYGLCFFILEARKEKGGEYNPYTL